MVGQCSWTRCSSAGAEQGRGQVKDVTSQCHTSAHLDRPVIPWDGYTSRSLIEVTPPGHTSRSHLKDTQQHVSTYLSCCGMLTPQGEHILYRPVILQNGHTLSSHGEVTHHSDIHRSAHVYRPVTLWNCHPESVTTSTMGWQYSMLTRWPGVAVQQVLAAGSPLHTRSQGLVVHQCVADLITGSARKRISYYVA